MTTRSEQDAAGSLRAFYDDQSGERLALFQPVVFVDDFIGAATTIPTAATAGVPFIAKLVKSAGTPTLAGVADAAGGVVEGALDNTAEKQEATLYFGDQLQFDVTKGVIFEARVNLAVLPSAAGVEAVFGLQSAWADGPDNATEYLRFQANGSGAINAQAEDGTTTTSDASGVTVVAGTWHIFRIDATDPTNVLFFIDGVEVASGVSFAATGAAAILQPYMSVYKAAGAGVATFQVDYVKIGNGR